jgi:hypothetical protein
VELDHIDKDTESMTTLILNLNQILDTISVEFNNLETTKETITNGSILEAEVQSVLKRIIGKNFKMGSSNASSVSNNTLFVDGADLKLKFKDKNGITASIT